jgi:hypothetical protein
MKTYRCSWLAVTLMVGLLAAIGSTPQRADAMCGYFRPIIVDLKQPVPEVLQPSQIAFVTWDPDKKVETVTVQPRFEGNAADFGMVIPTPAQPKLHEMPRDFFKALGLFTTPMRRVIPESRLMPQWFGPFGGPAGPPRANAEGGLGGGKIAPPPRPTTVEVIEVGQVGNLDYKIITAGRPDDLYTWLKDNKYSYSGDEATLNYYVQKKYFFTVMKIDTLQMRKNADGTYTGDVTPTRFSFTSEQLVYPTKITQVSVKDKTEALFYVQAPFKVDLPGEMSYQYQWVSMLEQIQSMMGPEELTKTNQKFLGSIKEPMPNLLRKAQELGFQFRLGQEVLAPNKQGRTASTVEWAKRLTAEDAGLLAGTRPYSEQAPDPDDGFTQVDLRDPQRQTAIFKIIQHRLAKYQQERPRGYLVREAKKDDLKVLPVLKGHLQEGQYLTRFRHTFTKAELAEDLVLVRAKVGDVEDVSEHEEVLRTMHFGGPGRFGPFGPGGGLGLPVPPGVRD